MKRSEEDDPPEPLGSKVRFVLSMAIAVAGALGLLAFWWLRPAPVTASEAAALLDAREALMTRLVGEPHPRHSEERLRRAVTLADDLDAARSEVKWGSSLDSALEKLSEAEVIDEGVRSELDLMIEDQPFREPVDRWLQSPMASGDREFMAVRHLFAVRLARYRLEAARMDSNEAETDLWVRRLLELAEMYLVAPELYASNVGGIALQHLKTVLGEDAPTAEAERYRDQLLVIQDAIPSAVEQQALHLRDVLRITREQVLALRDDRERGMFVSWMQELWAWEDRLLEALAIPAGSERSMRLEAIEAQLHDESDFVRLMAVWSPGQTELLESYDGIIAGWLAR